MTYTARDLLRTARSFEDGVIANRDPEDLHQFRVHLRKLRSLLDFAEEVLEPNVIRALRRVSCGAARRTGRARDLNVFVETLAREANYLPKDLRSGGEAVLERFRRERQRSHRAVGRYLASQGYRKAMEQAGYILEKRAEEVEAGANKTTLLDLVAFRVRKRLRKFCRLMQESRKKPDETFIHDIRIQCKKLRYLLELFGDFLPGKEAGKVKRPLGRLQESLGTCNDLLVQMKMARECLACRIERRPLLPEEAAALGGVLMLLKLLHRREIKRARKAVKAFCESKPVAKLNDACRPGALKRMGNAVSGHR